MQICVSTEVLLKIDRLVPNKIYKISIYTKPESDVAWNVSRVVEDEIILYEYIYK